MTTEKIFYLYMAWTLGIILEFQLRIAFCYLSVLMFHNAWERATIWPAILDTSSFTLLTSGTLPGSAITLTFLVSLQPLNSYPDKRQVRKHQHQHKWFSYWVGPSGKKWESSFKPRFPGRKTLLSAPAFCCLLAWVSLLSKHSQHYSLLWDNGLLSCHLYYFNKTLIGQ